MIGRQISHYRILEKLGAGGMGEVYKAEDLQLGRFVALKFLPPELASDPQALERFRREARAASALDHPHICTIYEIGEHEGQPFIAMQYLEGQTLKQRISGNPMPADQLVRVGLQTTEALEAAHAKGIIHRDIKPANIFLTQSGQAKVVDFGLAKWQPRADEATAMATLTEVGAVSGTLPYMAPEQLRGRPLDPRTDLYALGGVLYEMATGQRPFREELATQLTDDILHKPPAPPTRLNPDLPAELERIILKCLEKDAENRYQSAKELAVDLRRLAAPAATLLAPSPQAPAWGRSWQQWGMAAAALSVLLTVPWALNVGGVRDRLLRKPGSPRIESIAVLPLENLSGDPEQEYFADGMTEALITDLAQIGALKVISRTSVMRYKGARKPLPEIAKELNVDAVVEGSVLRAGQRVRITAQLIHASTDTHLWAQSYERDLKDVLALQDEVARAIAGEIKVKLTPQEEARLSHARPVDPEAHEAYLRGVYHLDRVTLQDFRKAIEYFQQAQEKDPAYAPAYAGLADAYASLVVFGGLAPREGFPKAEAAVTKALALDPGLAHAHSVLATNRRDYDWDWPAAEKEFRRALELSPGYARAHWMYAILLMIVGRFDEAQREIEQARRLDPVNPGISNDQAWLYYLLRRYDRATELYRKNTELDPAFMMSHRELGIVYAQRGRFKESLAEFQKALALGREPNTVTDLAYAYALAGKKSEARKLLAELTHPDEQALVYLGLGEKEAALRSLEKAFQERSPYMLWLKVDPRFDPLRDDPRFQALLRRMNFP